MPSRPRFRPPPLPSLALLREVLAHWSRERVTIRQGFVALGINVSVTIVAGVVLGAMESLLERTPGLLVLVPAAIGMRGAIFGALAARLGTGMLTGVYEPRGARTRRSFLGQNVEASLLLSVVTAALSALLAWLLAGAFDIPTIGVLPLTAISLLAALLSSGLVLALVLVLARTAHSRSWDMDAIGTPIVSASADITTLPALVVATLVVRVEVLGVLLGALGLLGAAAALYVGVRNDGQVARRIVRESLPVLGYAALMGILAGTVLSVRLEALVTSPALLVIVPPFIAASGALGGILSARLASALHLGLLSPRPLPERRAALEGTLLVLFAVLGFAVVGLLGGLASAATGLASPGTLALMGVTLLAGLFATGILFLVAYYAGTASYRFGLDPDNYGIPIVTSTMDFVGILCLVGAIALLRVG